MPDFREKSIKMTVRHRENVNKEDANGKPKDKYPFKGRYNPK